MLLPPSGGRLGCMNGESRANTLPSLAGTSSATREFAGRDALRDWLDCLVSQYAADVHWSAPRRGVNLHGRAAVVAHLHDECVAMEEPRVCVLRDAESRSQRFHEFTIRFRLGARGIAGIAYPAGADVELERLRVCTYDESCRIVAETCIETWTWLPAAAGTGSAGG